MIGAVEVVFSEAVFKHETLCKLYVGGKMGTIEKEGFLSKDIEIVINSNVERYGIFFALGKKFNMLG